MELRQKERWKCNLDAMDWAIKNSPTQYTSILVDNKFLLATMFEENGVKGAIKHSKSEETCPTCGFTERQTRRHENPNWCSDCGTL